MFLRKLTKNVKCHFLSFSPTLNAITWTAAKNEVFKGLTLKPMLTVSNCLLIGKLALTLMLMFDICHS